MISPIRIVLVDDHRVVTRSLKAYLESFPDLEVVGMAASGEELLERVNDCRPQVVLQDLLLPGGMDGIEATRRVLQRRPEVRVIADRSGEKQTSLWLDLRDGDNRNLEIVRLIDPAKYNLDISRFILSDS